MIARGFRESGSAWPIPPSRIARRLPSPPMSCAAIVNPRSASLVWPAAMLRQPMLVQVAREESADTSYFANYHARRG
jgi:hypothetical protein